MFCPNCGVADQSPDAYCKKCGDWLSDQKGITRPSLARHLRGKTPEESMQAMMIFSGLNAFLALFSSIALYATYLGKPEAKWSVYFAAAFGIVIAIHQTVSFVSAMELRQRLKRGREDKADRLEGSHVDRTKAIKEAAVGSLRTPSVTENTTELLSRPRTAKEIPVRRD